MTTYLVLCKYKSIGTASQEWWSEAPIEDTLTALVQRLSHGLYHRPVRVLALDAELMTCVDVSTEVARQLLALTWDEHIPADVVRFAEAHND